MKITKANLGDVNQLNQLVNSAYRGEESKRGWTTEAEILDGIRIDENALTELLTSSKVTILKCIESDKKISGCVCLEIKRHDLNLGMLAVSPHSQGYGIGKLLLAASEEYALANQCSRIVISVISTRNELIDWYQRRGYMGTGSCIAFEEIDGRFGDPKVDAIRLIEMKKLLDR